MRRRCECKSPTQSYYSIELLFLSRIFVTKDQTEKSRCSVMLATHACHKRR